MSIYNLYFGDASPEQSLVLCLLNIDNNILLKARFLESKDILFQQNILVLVSNNLCINIELCVFYY